MSSIRQTVTPAIQNRTLNNLAVVCGICFLILNLGHYLAFVFDCPFSKTQLWLDIRGLLNSVLINLLAAYVFFFLIVHRPNLRSREIIRNNLRRRYYECKEDIVREVLAFSGGNSDGDTAQQLCDFHKFRTYFSQDDWARWYAVKNSLTGDAERLRVIVVELKILRDEVAFALSKIETRPCDNDMVTFFRNLNSIMYRYEQTGCEYDDIESFANFLWELLACQSFTGGKAKEDVIQKFIDTI